MKKFEIGKLYMGRSIYDHNCIYTVSVLSRTDKTITVAKDDGVEQRYKIRIDNIDGEYIKLDNYSMSPIIRASREYKYLSPTLEEEYAKDER